MYPKRRHWRSSHVKFKILMKSEVRPIPSALVCVEGAIACDIKCLIRSKTIWWEVKPACKIKCKLSKGYCRMLSRPHRLPQASATSQCIISIQKCLQGSSRVPLMSNNSKWHLKWASSPHPISRLYKRSHGPQASQERTLHAVRARISSNQVMQH